MIGIFDSGFGGLTIEKEFLKKLPQYDYVYLGEGDIYYYYDNANHRFIIEWDSLSHNGFVTEPLSEVFQAILLDPAFHNTSTGDGEIIFQYKKVEEPETNTIGIENNFQDVGLQYVFNEDYDQTAHTLINYTAIKFTTEPPFTNLITSDNDDNYNTSTVGSYNLEQNIFFSLQFFGNFY